MRAKAAATRGTARDSGHRDAATLLPGSGAWGLERARGHPSEAFVGEVVRAGLVGGRAAAPQGPSPPNTNSFLRPVPGAGLGSWRAVSGALGRAAPRARRGGAGAGRPWARTPPHISDSCPEKNSSEAGGGRRWGRPCGQRVAGARGGVRGRGLGGAFPCCARSAFALHFSSHVTA